MVLFMAADSKNKTNGPIINASGAIVPNLCPLLTVKQRRAVVCSDPQGEPCLCMGALYTPTPPMLITQTALHTNKSLLHILPKYPAPFNLKHDKLEHKCLTLLWKTNNSLFCFFTPSIDVTVILHHSNTAPNALDSLWFVTKPR